MNVVVYVGDTVPSRSPGVAHYATNLVKTIAGRPDLRVTVLGEAVALDTYRNITDVRLVDEADRGASRPTEADTLIQVHQLQRRPIDVPTIVVVHDLALYDASWAFAPDRARAVRALHKNVMRADVVVSHFPGVVDRLPEIEPRAAGKSVLTVCPPLLANDDVDESTVAAVRLRFGLGDGRPTIVYPARRQLHKNHWALLNALAEVQRDGLDVRLVCPGVADPAYWAEALEQRVEYLDLANVHFPGYLADSDLRALYSMATGIVSPGLAEGGAYAAREALDHGVAVACAAIPNAVADLDRMRLGIPTFDPFDVDEISGAITCLVADHADIVGAYDIARDTVSDWNWDRLVDQLLVGIEGVCS